MSTFIPALSRSETVTDTYLSPGHSHSDLRFGSSSAATGRRRTWYALAGLLFCLFAQTFAHASTYYLSPNGSDSNNGTSASASWLSPNHSLNCGDVIVAAASTSYSATNFYTGKWGTVTCAAGNSVAWLKCATFDACKISANANQGMWVDKSYWGVQGWEVTTSASDFYGACFIAQPNYSHPVEIHHIIFANDIANGCSQGGFITVNRGNASVDYLAVIGSIAYNAAEGSNSCASGISIYQPVESDSAAGTHIYIAGNFAYSNLDPHECQGGSPTDGEGIIFDTFDGRQGGPSKPYAAQAVAYNNIAVNNGEKGIYINSNDNGSSPHATVYFSQNTSWGNLTDPNQSWYGCAEVAVYESENTHVSNNLVSTKSATGCGGHPIYALSMAVSDNTDSIVDNFAYGYSGNNTFVYEGGSFSLGSTNHLGVSPNFTNPVVPGAPRCGGTSSVPSCMSSVIADFVPKAAGSQGFGYQRPGSASVKDPLFPRWLCTANVPAGLVTMGCS